ncbi:pyruvate, phosphate dikinase [Tautonia plasticadhaerens]|uniref:Pyruvate, phosphate dikinase n=1 Tax=Tautonia plasticadhaerens TaxID=2527974 RepID=A0A518H521_9BACT|nr:pyruvate, phosphate dikinase [Tautonia plasticadhaerens]QDV35908.1 Pyruvate, phosphate dikinase [Tautonia plasticadhaerens]
MSDPQKYVYSFGGGEAEGTAKMKELLGGKGANLAEMSSIGIPVPPGFTITTEVCDLYYKNEKTLPEGLTSQVEKALARMEAEYGSKLGDPSNPLLVSVRSGAAMSMPGMMNTILNLGLSDASTEGLARKTDNPRFAYDGYRRLIDMFGSVVMGVDHEHFEHELQSLKDQKGVKLDTELKADDLKELVRRYKAVYEKAVGTGFPQDPMEQLWKAVEAVFRSWMGKKAIDYRRIEKISGLKGTAVNVQAMVFGNTGTTSGTGVAFTRDPNTGENEFYGDFLINAQGEDVVAGIRTPEHIADLEKEMPAVYTQLLEIRQTLETHYKEMQDIEFTIQDGTLYMLQTRTGKRTGTAAVKIAVDMAKEGLIDEKTAVQRVNPDSLNHLLLPQLDPKADAKPAARGIAASPGAACGKVVLTAEEAVRQREANPKVPLMLVRKETSPEDVAGMDAAVGILTSTGGKASHAAVVARGWGKPCIVGCEAVRINEKAGEISVNGTAVKAGDFLTINGTTGDVMIGEVPTIPPKMAGDFAVLMEWADKYRTLKIRTNADNPKDSAKAREFGAEGIGLCRTEHMFFEGQRIVDMRKMILADTEADRRKALDGLEPYQRDDFIGIFEAMAGLPVTIRLLDPPLHEFLPHDETGQNEVAKQLGLDVQKVRDRVESLHESNPMLGFRGCRLAVRYPEILEMQVRAIIDAAIAVKKKGIEVLPEIMIPLVGTVEEMALLKAETERVCKETIAKAGTEVAYLIGTMIEVPRAALTADKIAEHAEFFSFGTNDLTQMTFGYSRDDIKSFMGSYLEKKILPEDPFASLDESGVGQLVSMGVEKGRASRKAATGDHLKIGICGEHGGDPASVAFCHKVGLDYVSCSPFRVPIARLAAAQAAINMGATVSRDR